MHGDFSRWSPRIPKNQVGILAQEGRILLDADVNAHSLLGMRWQDLAARSAFGGGIAAIPADAIESWKVLGAQASGGVVSVNLMPGIAWADGLLVELEGTKPVTLTAMPLAPPIQTPSGAPGVAGTRDALVLEVWRRALNGFQVPAELIEPALGGPDTAERIETAFALRLYRMGAGDDCRTIIGALKDDLSSRGTLHATLAPLTTTAGDCPVVEGGGYSGFEHDLYRVEIAEVDSGAPSFKWSQWNGGLVGSGSYDALAKQITLRGNDQAIRYSGLTSCFLDVLELDAALGGWKIAYSARATIDPATGLIDVSGPKLFGVLPATNANLVIRIWNDLRAVSEFPAGSSVELRDGIRLELSGTTYVPGDYWTFAVRAGGLDNASPLLDHAAPFGIHHHRVVLAELAWTGSGATVEDCRVPLHPITAVDGCCTHSVGDGITSHGDFTSINAAIAALPDSGGRVCVLPGEYVEHVEIKNRRNIELVGCGPRSKIKAPPPVGETFTTGPALYVLDSSNIRVESLQLIAGAGGIGALFEADTAEGTTEPDGTFSIPFLEDIAVTECLVQANTGSGIEMRGGRRIELRDNHVRIEDQRTDWSGITVRSTDARIERNLVEVVNAKGKEFSALGGIWLRGGCRNIDVIDNVVRNGLAHGVILGHAELADQTPVGLAPALHLSVGVHAGWVFNGFIDDDCIGCGPGDGGVPPPGGNGPTWVASDPLFQIRIQRNTITNMGMAGIGVFGFFPTAGQGVITIYDLEITGNRIVHNVQRRLVEIPDDLQDLNGYGAISLADVIELAIRDNVIANNGTGDSGAMCGVFVLFSEGTEISRNKIIANGPSQVLRFASRAPHGGIWLSSVRSTGSGRVAAALRGNEVQAPNGPALVIGAYGHVEVLDNAFASTSSVGYLGYNTVIIEHFAVASGLLVADANMAGLRTGAMMGRVSPREISLGNRTAEPRMFRPEEILGATTTLAAGALAAAGPQRPVGAVLFANNHCELVLGAAAASNGSVVIFGLGDIECAGNHCYTSARSTALPVLLIGGTVRATSNRFAETMDVVWSLAAFGAYTIATSNIADHCVGAWATRATPVSTGNIEIDASACGWWNLFPFTFNFTPFGGLPS